MPTEDDCRMAHDLHTNWAAQFFRQLFFNLRGFLFFVYGTNFIPGQFCFFWPCLSKDVVMTIVIALTSETRLHDMISEVFFAVAAMKVLDLAWAFVEYPWWFTLLHIFGLVVTRNNLDLSVCSQNSIASSAAYLVVAVQTEYITNCLHSKLLDIYNYTCRKE